VHNRVGAASDALLDLPGFLVSLAKVRYEIRHCAVILLRCAVDVSWALVGVDQYLVIMWSNNIAIETYTMYERMS
jgi:hypothetical protein